MNKLKHILIFLLICFFFIIQKDITSSSDNFSVFFYNKNCSESQDILAYIDSTPLEKHLELNKIEASEADFDEIFSISLQICETPRPQIEYPTLFFGGDCYFQKEDILKILDSLNTAANNEKDIEVEEEEESLEIENQKENTEKKGPEQEAEGIITDNTSQQERESLPISLIITMFLGPAVFIYIAYLLIKKLNL